MGSMVARLSFNPAGETCGRAKTRGGSAVGYMIGIGGGVPRQEPSRPGFGHRRTGRATPMSKTDEAGIVG